MYSVKFCTTVVCPSLYIIYDYVLYSLQASPDRHQDRSHELEPSNLPPSLLRITSLTPGQTVVSGSEYQTGHSCGERSMTMDRKFNPLDLPRGESCEWPFFFRSPLPFFHTPWIAVYYSVQRQIFLQPVTILIARLYAPAFMITFSCILPKCNS